MQHSFNNTNLTTPRTSKTLLSVIVVNRNTADLLIQCLDHIFRSALAQLPEVVVIDNGSTDASADRVREKFPNAMVREAGSNLGFARANNIALAGTTGEFLLLVNTDALLDRDCAGNLLNLMTTTPHLGMAGPQLVNADGSLQTSYEAIPTLATETLNRSLLKRLFPRRFPGKAIHLSEPQQVEALIGAVMMIRREALVQMGGFDEDFFFFLEETDLALRMRRSGWLVMHHPQAKAIHLQGETAKAYRIGARVEFYRSRYTFFRKHYGLLSTFFLKCVLTANLTLNVLFLGAAHVITVGKSQKIEDIFRVRAALWIWHLRGCPKGAGLPRE